MVSIFTYLVAFALIAYSAVSSPVLLEAESFEEKGGWVVDPQFMDVMGSPFLLAHGLGNPVPPARTIVALPQAGTYRVYVRSRDWVVPHGPGRFAVAVNEYRLPRTFGVGGTGEWEWWDGGTVTVTNEMITVYLIDLTGFEGRCDAILFVPAQEVDTFIPPIANDFAWRRELLGVAPNPPAVGMYDFVVSGGGYAGMCAAVAAARLGLKTALIQNRPVLGGNASSEIRVCPIGKPGLPPFPRNSDILYEIHKLSNVTLNPQSYQRPPPDEAALERWIRNEKNLELFLNFHVFAVVTNGARIASIVARHIENASELRFDGRFFADCTGDATVGFLAGADYRTGSESREETGEPLAAPEGKRKFLGATNYWKTRWTDRDAPFPACPWALVIDEESLYVSSIGFDPKAPTKEPYAVHWNWESGFEQDQILEAERIRDHNFRAMYGAWDFLKNRSAQKERYRNAELYWAAYITGKRESRRLMGDYILTQDDFTEHRLYEDGCVTTTWYLDLHFPHPDNARFFPGQEFRSAAYDDPEIKRLLPEPPNEMVRIEPYPIPFRCFYSRNIENLFMAGRNMSGTHVALASPRVMNTTAQMGAVIGRAAYLCVKTGCPPRELVTKHWDKLKALLTDPGEQTTLSITGERMLQGRDSLFGEIKWQIRKHTGMPVRRVATYGVSVLGIVLGLAVGWWEWRRARRQDLNAQRSTLNAQRSTLKLMAMRASSRILLNTGVTYARSLLALALGLFSTRWVLQGLGAVDYGLFGVVGSITVFITFLNSVMAMSASRHLSFAMGRCRSADSRGSEELRAWFNASLSIHALVPTLLVLVGYPLGVWVVRNWLVIPPERLVSCVWVFRLSVFSAFVSMTLVPFRAVYAARQHIAEQAVYESIGTLLSFAFAWTLLSYAGDRLIYYACYGVGVGLFSSLIYVTRAWIAFPETRLCFRQWWDPPKMKELSGFAAWNFFGALGWLGSNQGVAVIGNKFFGPLVNAALNVGTQVSAHVTALTHALTNALNPEIVTTEGAGDRQRVMRLAFSSCRLASLLNLLFMLPLAFEMEYVLGLWLKTPPEGAVLFCRIALLAALFNSLSTGHAVAMGAEGRIRGYQLTVGFLMLLALPLAWFGCKAGFPAWVVPGSSAFAVGICSLGRVWWARRQVGMPVWLWLREVLLPVMLLCLLTGAALTTILSLLPPSFGRLMLTSGTGGGMVIACALLFVLSSQERAQMRAMLTRSLQKVFPARKF